MQLNKQLIIYGTLPNIPRMTYCMIPKFLRGLSSNAKLNLRNDIAYLIVISIDLRFESFDVIIFILQYQNSKS